MKRYILCYTQPQGKCGLRRGSNWCPLEVLVDSEPSLKRWWTEAGGDALGAEMCRCVLQGCCIEPEYSINGPASRSAPQRRSGSSDISFWGRLQE